MSDKSSNRVGCIYFLRRGDLVKVGFSTNVERRMAEMQHHMTDILWLVRDVPPSREREFHYALRKWWSFGEWFEFTDESRAVMERLVAGEELEPVLVMRDKMARRRSDIASIAAHESWAATEDRSARTAPARRALEEKFLAEAGGDPIRAENLRKAHYKRLAMKSVESRARKRAARQAGVAR